MDAQRTEPVTVQNVELVKADVVAHAINTSERWVYRRAASGDLPSVRLPGGMIRFNLAQVLRHIGAEK